ncbi:MAG: hypothetical protein AB1831_08715 [Pseudomonadota bacterium]
MKSIVLLVWLALANGKEQVILSRHLDDQATCVATAQALVAQHAAQGGKARYLCQEVVEEVGGVDINGNPIEPAVMHAQTGTATR